MRKVASSHNIAVMSIQPRSENEGPSLALGLSRKSFGDYTLFTIGNADTHVSFVPERSAYVHQVRINGRNLLWNYASGLALTENSAYCNPALLPFPNRLFEGKYEWNGTSHEFEVNHPDSRSTLHGFGPDAAFSVERYDLSAQNAKVKMTWLHRASAHTDSYPFSVRFEVVLAIDLKSQNASWQLSAMNLGSASAPVGLGWHPYFLLPGGHEQWKIQMPANKQVALNNAIPTGVLSKGLSPKHPTPINTNWDDCYKLTDKTDMEVQLLGPVYSLSLKQTGRTRYTQLYVPGGNESLAVEPMTCGVNAFNTDKEEVELASGETISTGMVISLM